MESVTEKIALEVGPKWIQLHSRLGLGPRDRWRIDSEHADKPMETKLQNCACDCIQLWRKTVQDLDEMEAIRELLIALRKVPGCAYLAEELSRVNGETIIVINVEGWVSMDRSGLRPFSQFDCYSKQGVNLSNSFCLSIICCLSSVQWKKNLVMDLNNSK